MKALAFSTVGGPEVLRYIEVPEPIVSPGELLIEMKAIGLNFADVYRRQGRYHLKGRAPFIAGYEGAGHVVDDNGIPDFPVGTRIAFADVPFANAERVVVPATHAIRLPDDISFETASALVLQGMTAYYLATDSHATRAGEVVLVHACAGGVGQLLTQICTLYGATVVGLTSSESKGRIALACGAKAAFVYDEDWKGAVRAHTNGEGVDVVFDSVGVTLSDSFYVTRQGGQVVFYGMSGGNPPAVDPRMLMDGSKTLTGGDLWYYLSSQTERARRANQLFDWVRTGQLRLQPPTMYPLSEGRAAHQKLESRLSTGKILLIP